ncbi:MAG: hypothetical protein B6I38_07765 [Anaerolineaceae bacterium 4572_5.1]|nr:MAG: hypothetical protein B6I38_07765 [Anaerolineaceae bacterium 4572_5.1]
MSTDFLFHEDLEEIAPFVHDLIQWEEERQARKLIFIPSESYAPKAVRKALGSRFQNIYAEGYPPSSMVRDPEERLHDVPWQLAYYRRYADRRFYKGVDYVNLVESLAQRRCAQAFAHGDFFRAGTSPTAQSSTFLGSVTKLSLMALTLKQNA